MSDHGGPHLKARLAQLAAKARVLDAAPRRLGMHACGHISSHPDVAQLLAQNLHACLCVHAGCEWDQLLEFEPTWQKQGWAQLIQVTPASSAAATRRHLCKQ